MKTFERQVSDEHWWEMFLWKAELGRHPTKEEVVAWLREKGYGQDFDAA